MHLALNVKLTLCYTQLRNKEKEILDVFMKMYLIFDFKKLKNVQCSLKDLILEFNLSTQVSLSFIDYLLIKLVLLLFYF